MLVRIIAGLFLGFVVLTAPVSACPLCKDAIATNDPDEEINNLPAAYNNSIYLMVSVPYLTLGIGGFFIYRGLRLNAEYLKNSDADGPKPGQP